MDKKALLSTLDRIIETKVEMIRQTYSEVAPKEVEKEIKSDALYGFIAKGRTDRISTVDVTVVPGH